MKDELSYIKNSITPLHKKSPILLLEQAAILFRNSYNNEIHDVLTDEDLVNLVSSYSNIDYRGLLVIGGLSMIKNKALLLKFIEEASFPIIVLCNSDSNGLDNILLSRFQTIIKIPNTSGACNIIPAIDGLETFREQARLLDDKTEYGRNKLEDKIFATESPEYYYLKNKSSRYVCNDKIIDLLSRS